MSACSGACTCLCMYISCGSVLGHIRDRVPQKWVSRCHEGELLARCSLRRLEVASGFAPLRPATRDRPSSSPRANVVVSSPLAPLPWIEMLFCCDAGAACGARVSVCHSGSASATRHPASAGSMIRKRDLGQNAAELYFVFQLQYFLFKNEWIPQ